MKTRHISFDVWNTLITGNQDFQPRRTEVIAKHLPVDAAFAKQTYTETKAYFDALAEREGKAHTCDEVYDEFITRLTRGIGLEANWLGFTPVLRSLTEDLFRQFPPHILPSTIWTLQALHGAGYTISIGSNTNFISGTVLSEILDPIIPFEYKVFSDLDGYSKPHPEFFGMILDRARAVQTAEQPEGRADLSRGEILHVGDNLICDGAATQAGMNFFYVRGPAELPKVAETLGIELPPLIRELMATRGA